MNLIPIGWRPGSVPELEPLPKAEGRKLWDEAWNEELKARGAWLAAGFAVILLVIPPIGDQLGITFGKSTIFSVWARVVKAATGGRLNLGSETLASWVSMLVLFTLAFYLETVLLQGSVIRRIRRNRGSAPANASVDGSR